MRRWWKRAALAAGALLILVGIVVGVGAALPVSHTATVSAEVPAPPAEVWALITDVERFPEWRRGVTAVHRLEARQGRPVWREESAHGLLTFGVEEWDPPHLLVTRILDEDLPFGGRWTYEISPDGEGARLRITEAGEVYNPLFRFMSRFVFGHESSIRDYLLDVERELQDAR